MFDSTVLPDAPAKHGKYQLGDHELIVDLFAGGGGASEGIFLATGRHPDIAINHDQDAIAVHTRNHPETSHYCQSIWKVHPLEACGDKPVGLLWVSPSCTHFSRAAGGVPKSKQLRSLPGVTLTWAKYVRPKIICVENVREMRDWGPLLPDGQPCQKRIGRSFKAWCGRLRGLGYTLEWKELRAADYGVPTIRTRLFIVARCDGEKVSWPQPTHHATPSLFEKPWRTAAECIDWSIPCPSIFTRKRPLKDATLARIAEGLQRYVINADNPFILDYGLPHISSMYGTSTGSRIDQPLQAVTAQGQHHSLVSAYLAPITHQGSRRGSGMNAPVPTITCANRGEHALLSAVLSGCGGRAAQSAPKPVTDPMNTITAKADQMLVSAWIAQHNGGNVGRGVDEPLSTLTTTAAQQQVVQATLSPEDEAGAERVAAFLVQYYGQGKRGQSLREPLGSIVTRGRFALVTVRGVPTPIVDIGMRMLAVHELKAAQGFSPSYDLTDGGRISKTAQIRLVGNSVCPELAAAVIDANIRRVTTPLEAAAA